MLGICVTVPVACFRKGAAREYLETDPVPPPATCYGFLLSMVGEIDRRRHVGAHITPVLLNRPAASVVLRTIWRVKNRPLGSAGNTRPDYQQLLTGVELVVWVDSSEESGQSPLLEDRVRTALDPLTRGTFSRFGGLSLGESTHLVDEVCLLDDRTRARLQERKPRSFLLHPTGRTTLPVWVDHVGSIGTRYVTGNLAECDLSPPPLERMPQIRPPD
jgi:CRISPR-associated protein Cas5t